MMDPLRDPQSRPAAGECVRCHGELYNLDSELCPACEEEIHSNDIVVQYAEAWPRRLFKFLWSEKDEEDMEWFLAAFREYCVGSEFGCPDMDEWAKS